jgi:hypothetical protein
VKESGAILAFDGMTVKDGIFYDRYSGDLIGMEDVGDLVSYTRIAMSDKAGVSLAKECMQLRELARAAGIDVPN